MGGAVGGTRGLGMGMYILRNMSGVRGKQNN